jgi:GTPase SAR1 family protein
VDRALRKVFYNRCNPEEALADGDDRYVNLDEPSGERRETARGEDWLNVLAGQFEFDETPQTLLFTGLPGSGKSTLLRRLVERIRHSDGANLLPVVIDAEEFLDTRAEIDVADVRCATLVAIDRVLLGEEGRRGATPMSESPFARFWSWLRSVELGPKELELSGEIVGVGAKLVAEMKASETIRKQVRERVARSPKTFIEKADEVIQEEFVERARALGYAGLVVVVDSLEKIRGVSSNWTAVLDSAERLFAGGAPDLCLPVHAIYTFPPALILRLNARVHFLPMIKLAARDGRRFELGYRQARALIERRVPPTALADLLGDATWESRVERVITWSGGHPRQILHILRRLLLQEPPIVEAVFDRVLGMEGDSYRRVLTAEAYPWLAAVALSHRLRLNTSEDRAIADEMFANSIVLRYFNGTEWYGLHPAVMEVDEVREAIAKGRAQRTGP